MQRRFRELGVGVAHGKEQVLQTAVKPHVPIFEKQNSLTLAAEQALREMEKQQEAPRKKPQELLRGWQDRAEMPAGGHPCRAR